MRRFQRLGRTSRTCGNADSELIQKQKNRFALNELKGDVCVARMSAFHRAVQLRIRNFLQDSVNQIVSKFAAVLNMFVKVYSCEFSSLAEAYDSGKIFRSGSLAVFLRAAVNIVGR